jgi:hypothetical protein
MDSHSSHRDIYLQDYFLGMARGSDIFGENADARVMEVKSWLKSKGVRDFEHVSLFSDQLSKETIREIEEYADSINKGKSPAAIKKTMVENIPRHAVLKPAHSIYRLQNQHFALGDRVIMAQDSGGVPLSIKGVVIGINSKTIDVIWDIPLMSGVTLGDRYVKSVLFVRLAVMEPLPVDVLNIADPRSSSTHA